MSEKKDIKVAETAGFCWGVKRAMDLTLKTANETDGPVYTHGPLIHNPQVIEMLEGKEVYAVDDASDIGEGGVVVIRTHGVTPQVRKALKARDLTISDATCPLVAKVQGIIKKYTNKGYNTIVIGDKGHAEVIGLAGYANGLCHVVESVDDVKTLPPMEKVSLVAQTTCDTTRYDHIVEALLQKYPEAVVNNTICDATTMRQSEVLLMATEVDTMIVVGGKNSANTNRLAAITKQAGTKTLLIETEEELDACEIANFNRIGLTAGASTPNWMIARVRDRLVGLRKKRASSMSLAITETISALVLSNVSVAIGAGMMVFANSTLARIEFSWGAAMIAALYLFSMHVLNRLNDVSAFRHNEPEKIKFYFKHSRLMKMAAGISVLLTLGLAFSLGPGVTLVLVASIFLGLGYTVKWFPKSELIRIHRLKDIPASKDLFVGFAWAVVTAIVPALAYGGDLFTAPVAVAFIFTFTLAYVRSVLSDIRDIHGDKMVGRETIPILIGKKATKIFLFMLTIGLALGLFAASYFQWVGPFGYALLLSVAYTGLYLWLYHRRVISRGLPYDLAVDGAFHFTGLMAIIWVSF
ncbi:4-hydroxy-3-methylbut-2-enyl diphosphate reductase [hydrothermal vent metagenome]|uniref:4-hydroxy-3-methylbut-2-enyl diphosphate reductase n=1 Tax=hydrothermal vent metagenome TaxID=652676 RepID=A0A3B1CMY4_9ZZZZ